MNVAQETLGFRRAGFSPALTLLMSAVALLIPPAHLSMRLRRLTERSPTRRAIPAIHSRSSTRLAKRADALDSIDEGRFGLGVTSLREVSLVQACCKNELGWIARIRSFGVQFEPRYIFRAGRLDQ